MKVLTVHNRYQQPGGEDVVVEAERELLRSAGHEVIVYTCDNKEIANYGLRRKATLAARTVWAWDRYKEVKKLLAREHPDVAHFHNTFPLISPAAYYACRDAGVPVVQTLHNFRLLCPGGSLFRNGKTCRECVEHNLFRSILHGCYRSSRGATLAVASMLATHRLLGTWTQAVHRYITLTEIARQRFIRAGLPGDKIAVKPNFVPSFAPPAERCREHALFVGRLSREKGIPILLAAWSRIKEVVPLRIIGQGPLETDVAEATQRVPELEWLGQLSRTEVLSNMRKAAFLVLPMAWDTFGLALVAMEAFANGTPIIASKIGALAELVAHGCNGLHFAPGDSQDLAAKVEWAWAHPEQMRRMGLAARREYEAKYTAERNYEILMDIYEQAVRNCKATRTVPAFASLT